VQASPSEQAVPFWSVGFEQPPVDGSHVPVPWHASGAGQLFAVPGVQVPEVHASPSVHAFPSLQGVPSLAVGFVHCPVLRWQTPAIWQAPSAVHVTKDELRQVPRTQ
jgi:hypothetical protein